MNIENYLEKEQRRIQEIVAAKFPQYLLTGGTALAFYFKHRHSEDLDFFSQKYSSKEAGKIMEHVSRETGYKHELKREQEGGKLIPMKVYELELKHEVKLKVDIVQDPYRLLKPAENGVQSVEDIYYRKLQIPLNPVLQKQDEIGRVVSGSRQKARDLFDLSYLSENYKNLSEFYKKNFSPKYFDRLDSWYCSIDRMDVKDQLLKMGLEANVFSVLDREIIKKLGRDPAIQREMDQGLGL